MNRKPEIPGENNRMKRSPSGLPSEWEVVRKLKRTAEEEHRVSEASPRNVDRHVAPRQSLPRERRHHDGKHAA